MIVPQEDGCWHWTGHLSTEGYGPYRKVYMMFRGPIPEGLSLDHLCRVRHCVNPDHLEPVTPRENTLRMWEFRRANPVLRPTRQDYPYPQHPDIVGTVEIAERLGVKRAAVDQWRTRGTTPPFPKESWLVGGRPAWDWADIEAWAEARKEQR